MVTARHALHLAIEIIVLLWLNTSTICYPCHSYTTVTGIAWIITVISDIALQANCASLWDKCLVLQIKMFVFYCKFLLYILKPLISCISCKKWNKCNLSNKSITSYNYIYILKKLLIQFVKSSSDLKRKQFCYLNSLFFNGK